MQAGRARDHALELVRQLDEGPPTRGGTLHPLPTDVFRSGAVEGRERDALWATTPQVVAYSAEVPEPGDFVTVGAGYFPLMVVRGDDGVVRVFRNSCVHRGAPVEADRSGHRPRFRCGYHGWTYNRSGELRVVPDDLGVGLAACTGMRLPEVPSAEINGLVIAVPSPGTDHLDPLDHLGELDERLAEWDLAGWHHVHHGQTIVAADWKLALLTFGELAHIAYLHEDSAADLFETRASIHDVLGHHQQLVAARSSLRKAAKGIAEGRDARRHLLVITLAFPNTVFLWLRDHIEAWRFWPIQGEPGRCTATLDVLCPRRPSGAVGRAFLAANIEMARRTVEDEDFTVAEAMQHNIDSDAQPFWHLTPGEAAIEAFIAAWDEAIR